MIHILLPIMVMTLYAAMRKIDPDLMRAAASLGARPFAAFRSVYLPLSAPGIVSGSTIVFVLCIGFYVTPVLIGSPREQMIAGVIGNRIEEFLAFGEASAIAMVLLAVTLADPRHLPPLLRPRSAVGLRMRLSFIIAGLDCCDLRDRADRHRGADVASSSPSLEFPPPATGSATIGLSSAT